MIKGMCHHRPAITYFLLIRAMIMSLSSNTSTTERNMLNNMHLVETRELKEERLILIDRQRDSSWHSWHCPWFSKPQQSLMGVKQLMSDQNNPRSLGLEEWWSKNSPTVECSLPSGYNEWLMTSTCRCQTVFTSPSTLSHRISQSWLLSVGTESPDSGLFSD